MHAGRANPKSLPDLLILNVAYKSVIKKILALGCTGMPGFQRLLLFFLIERMVSQKTFGLFSMDYSLVQMFSFFTAVSWCGVVVSRLPKLNKQDKQIFLAKIINCSLVCYFIFSFILVVFYFFGFINFVFASLLFMFTWMLYQILRHYQISEKNYFRILVGDTLSIMAFCVLVVFDVEPYFALGLSLIAAVIVFYSASILPNFCFIGVEEQKNAFEIGLFNFLLGLNSVALPFVVGYSGNIEYAGLLAYVSTLVSIIQLIPRAIGFNYMPHLAKTIEVEEFKSIYKKHVLVNHATVILSVIILLGFGLVLKKFKFVEAFNVDGSLYIYVSLTLCGALLAFSLPYVNYFMVKEKTSYLRKVGLGNSLLTFVSLLVFYFQDSDFAIFILVINLVIIATIKLLYFYVSVKRDFNY